jgi:uncharacterized repeat protein (TIGR01451 family)
VKKAISVGVVLTFALLAMALAGATSAAGPGGATPSAVSGQIRAAGAAVVKQIGLRNYAGPNCPGVSWNCTTSTRVFQVATRGGINLATPSCPPAGTYQSCDITQDGPATNVFNCTEKSTTGVDQLCKVTQTGASNTATINQYISQSTGATQSGTQTADVTQKPYGNTVYNVLKVTQSMSQNTKTPGAQTQNAHQKVVASQTALGAGYNQSFINQSQLQKAYGGSNQYQDATSDSIANCVDGEPSAPNACSDVTQLSANGTNYNALNQSINQDANTAVSVPAAHQTQGTWNGGLEGHVHQETTGSGSSQNKAKQNKQQKVAGPASAVQTQYDPVRCCGTFTLIGPGVDDINQSSSIGASNPGALQKSDLIGESRTPNGKCSVNQHAAIDTASANNSETLAPCYFLILTTSCTANVITIDAPTRGDNCTAAEPDRGVTSSLLKEVRNGDESYSSATEASPGDTVDFQISYDNVNPYHEDAHSLTVTDVVPAGLTYVPGSCTDEPNTCSYNTLNKTITWDLGSVPGNEFPPLHFQAVVDEEASGTITNTATAATEEEGADAASDSATVEVVDPPVSSLTLSVRKTAGSSGPDVFEGDTLEYTIVYSNSGGPAHGVYVDGPGLYPAGTSPVLFTCPQSTTATTCTLGPTGDEGTVASDTDLLFRTATFTVTVDAGSTCIGYTAHGNTTEEGTLTSNPTLVAVSGTSGCIG